MLLDVRLGAETGLELLDRIKGFEDSVEVILVTAVKEVRTAVEAIKRGAYEYVTKPFDVDEMQGLVRRALEKRALQREVLYLRSELASAHGFGDIIGRHPEMVRIYERIAQVAQITATVLITGESGTGKELIARAIHHQGPRRERPDGRGVGADRGDAHPRTGRALRAHHHRGSRGDRGGSWRAGRPGGNP